MANRKKLERDGVDVAEWIRSTDFEKLPKKAATRRRPEDEEDEDEPDNLGIVMATVFGGGLLGYLAWKHYLAQSGLPPEAAAQQVTPEVVQQAQQAVEPAVEQQAEPAAEQTLTEQPLGEVAPQAPVEQGLGIEQLLPKGQALLTHDDFSRIQDTAAKTFLKQQGLDSFEQATPEQVRAYQEQLGRELPARFHVQYDNLLNAARPGLINDAGLSLDEAQADASRLSGHSNVAANAGLVAGLGGLASPRASELAQLASQLGLGTAGRVFTGTSTDHLAADPTLGVHQFSESGDAAQVQAAAADRVYSEFGERIAAAERAGDIREARRLQDARDAYLSNNFANLSQLVQRGHAADTIGDGLEQVANTADIALSRLNENIPKGFIKALPGSTVHALMTPGAMGLAGYASGGARAGAEEAAKHLPYGVHNAANTTAISKFFLPDGLPAGVKPTMRNALQHIWKTTNGAKYLRGAGLAALLAQGAESGLYVTNGLYDRFVNGSDAAFQTPLIASNLSRAGRGGMDSLASWMLDPVNETTAAIGAAAYDPKNADSMSVSTDAYRKSINQQVQGLTVYKVAPAVMRTLQSHPQFAHYPDQILRRIALTRAQQLASSVASEATSIEDATQRMDAIAQFASPRLKVHQGPGEDSVTALTNRMDEQIARVFGEDTLEELAQGAPVSLLTATFDLPEDAAFGMHQAMLTQAYGTGVPALVAKEAVGQVRDGILPGWILPENWQESEPLRDDWTTNTIKALTERGVHPDHAAMLALNMHPSNADGSLLSGASLDDVAQIYQDPTQRQALAEQTLIPVDKSVSQPTSFIQAQKELSRLAKDRGIRDTREVGQYWAVRPDASGRDALIPTDRAGAERLYTADPQRVQQFVNTPVDYTSNPFQPVKATAEPAPQPAQQEVNPLEVLSQMRIPQGTQQVQQVQQPAYTATVSPGVDTSSAVNVWQPEQVAGARR